MKLTATRQEASLYESLCPVTEKTFGNKGVPRYMEASMFDLLQWTDAPKADHSADYKTKFGLLKDRINKSGSHWQTEKQDNFRKHVYSPQKGKLFFGYTKSELAEQMKRLEAGKERKVDTGDENDFASEYQRSFAQEHYLPGYTKPKKILEPSKEDQDESIKIPKGVSKKVSQPKKSLNESKQSVAKSKSGK